jgi:hypothetical protein
MKIRMQTNTLQFNVYLKVEEKKETMHFTPSEIVRGEQGMSEVYFISH